MQLDVDVSPPANIIRVRLTLTHGTFDLDPSDLLTLTSKPCLILPEI